MAEAGQTQIDINEGVQQLVDLAGSQYKLVAAMQAADPSVKVYQSYVNDWVQRRRKINENYLYALMEVGRQLGLRRQDQQIELFRHLMPVVHNATKHLFK